MYYTPLPENIALVIHLIIIHTTFTKTLLPCYIASWFLCFCKKCKEHFLRSIFKILSNRFKATDLYLSNFKAESRLKVSTIIHSDPFP